MVISQNVYVSIHKMPNVIELSNKVSILYALELFLLQQWNYHYRRL